MALEEDKQALTLYCQQFAFAPNMVDPCSDILICNDSEIEYKYGFPADYEPYVYNPQQHMNHLMD